jgi:hypothetical protein
VCSHFYHVLKVLVVFALDLMSTYEGEHTIFGLLGQANLTQNDVIIYIIYIIYFCHTLSL